MALLCGRAGRLTAQNGVFRPRPGSIWTTIHNMGGNDGMKGDMRMLQEPPPGAALPFRQKMAAVTAALLCDYLSNGSQRQPMTA